MVSHDEHHSSSSMYYELDEDKQKEVNERLKASSYRSKGNLSPSVITNTTYDTSRVNMELLLAIHANNIEVYNANDGIYIEGATPLKPEDISVNAPVTDKPSIKEKIAKQCFSPVGKTPELTASKIKEKYLDIVFDTIKQLYLPDSLDDSPALHKALNERYHKITQLKKGNPVAYQLLRGSTNAYFTILSRSAAYPVDQEAFDSAYLSCRTAYNDFLNYSAKLIEENFMALDDSQTTWLEPIGKK